MTLSGIHHNAISATLTTEPQVVDCGNVAWYNRKEYSWRQIEAVRRELEQLGHRTLLIASSHSINRYKRLSAYAKSEHPASFLTRAANGHSEAVQVCKGLRGKEFN